MVLLDLRAAWIARALTTHLKQISRRELGFSTLAGVCPAVPAAGFDRLREWLAQGFAGEMHYLAKREAAYAHPRHVLDGVRSMVLLAMNYRTAEPASGASWPGERIPRYAWGHGLSRPDSRAVEVARRRPLRAEVVP